MEQADKDIAKAREEEPLIENKQNGHWKITPFKAMKINTGESHHPEKQTGLTDLRELTRFYTQYQRPGNAIPC